MISILGTGLCCVALLRRGSAQRPVTSLAGANIREQHARSVDARSVELDRLPTRVLTADAKESDGIECAICLCELAPGDSATLLPCGHEFHPGCIHKWLRVSSAATCPLCKADPLPPVAAVVSVAFPTYSPRAVRLPPVLSDAHQLPLAHNVGGASANAAVDDAQVVARVTTIGVAVSSGILGSW